MKREKNRQMMIFEDGKIIQTTQETYLWDGQFSRVRRDGPLIQFIKSIISKNVIMVIPVSDGNIRREDQKGEYHDVDWKYIEPYIQRAKKYNKIFILGTLCQIHEEKDIYYLYLPLDDDFFEKGIIDTFPKNKMIEWKYRSNDLIWRGGCSGEGGNQSLRARFVKELYGYPRAEKVRLSDWWSENKNIPNEWIAGRIQYEEFMKYKIFFIVDGNCIASNHMWGFATGCIPFIVSNSTCWFLHLAIPYVHYIPIQHDLSNLKKEIEWVKSHDREAEQIARNAYEFARFIFSSEFQKYYLEMEIQFIQN